MAVRRWLAAQQNRRRTGRGPSVSSSLALSGGALLWTRVVGAAELGQELVALVCAPRVLLHDLAEEVRDLLLAGVLRVPDVLPVVVACLECVVLHRDQVEGDVVEAGL